MPPGEMEWKDAVMLDFTACQEVARKIEETEAARNNLLRSREAACTCHVEDIAFCPEVSGIINQSARRLPARPPHRIVEALCSGKVVCTRQTDLF
jgi:hypothetical protein